MLRGAGWRVAALAVVAALPFLVLAGRVAASGDLLGVAGDHALIDLASRDAADLDQQLGVYSRYGFFHPGPALFYALAPVLELAGAGPNATVVANAVLFAALLALATAVVARRWGEETGAAWALASLVLVAALGLPLLAIPWNPLTAVPALVAALALAAAADRPWAAATLLAVAGLLVQTHIGTLAVVGALVITGAVLLWRHRPRPRHPWLVAAALCAAAAMWIPPMVQQVTAEPGNVGVLVRFFVHGGGDAPAPAASSLAAAGRALFLPDLAVTGSLDHVGFGWILLPLALLGALAVAAWVRRGTVVGRVAMVAVVALVALLVASVRVAGSRFWYLFVWLPAVSVPVLALLARLLPGLARRLVVPVAAAVLSLGLAVTALTGPVFDHAAFPQFPRERAELDELAAAAGTPEGPVLIRLPESLETWPLAAGLAVVLEARGVDTYFGPEFSGYVPPARIRRKPAPTTFVLVPREQRRSDGRLLAETETTRLYATADPAG